MCVHIILLPNQQRKIFLQGDLRLLKPNETVTADVYRSQLNKLNHKLLQKRPAIASNKRKVILLHDNARPHVARIVKDTLLRLEWELLPQPAVEGYHLFRSMQRGLAGTQVRNDEEVRKWMDDWIAAKPKSFFQHGIAMLPKKWKKVIENDREYFG